MTFQVAFYKGTRPGAAGLYNRLVRWWERGPYSHCELVFSDGISASSSFMDGGVRIKEIEYDSERWDFVDIPLADEAAARQWFLDHLGAGYDVLGNIRFGLGFLPDSGSRFFCSEAVGASLGLPQPWRYGPNGLYSALCYVAATGLRVLT